jgi:hypothetical protein
MSSDDFLAISDSNYAGDFIKNFNFLMMPNYKKAIACTYYALTTLSTIGLGDFRPVSNGERIMGAFSMLWGVMIFSSIMGTFMDLLTNFKESNKSFDDGDNLSKFFGAIKQFNEKPLDDILKH